jgi:SAM-dependent methyltransferase
MQVQKWPRTLPPDSSVIDLGCGAGLPITTVLVEEGLDVFGVDAAPSSLEIWGSSENMRNIAQERPSLRDFRDCGAAEGLLSLSLWHGESNPTAEFVESRIRMEIVEALIHREMRQ